MHQSRGIRSFQHAAVQWTCSASMGVLILALSACDDSLDISSTISPDRLEIETLDTSGAGIELRPEHTALLIVDPQNDFLSSKGAIWGLVGKTVVENHVVANLSNLLKTAQIVQMPVFVAPHHYHSAIEEEHAPAPRSASTPPNDSFDAAHLLNFDDIDGFRARWHDDLAPSFAASNIEILSDHRLDQPVADHLKRSLRNLGISTIILAGVPADLCLNDHLRVLIEDGFEVMVVTDATAGVVTRDYDGNQIAAEYFATTATATATTTNTIAKIQSAYDPPLTLQPP